MKTNYTLPLIIVFFSFIGQGYTQSLKKSDLRGSYSKSTGVPTKWIHNDDGSNKEVTGMEYSRTTLYLKRFGRVKIVVKDQRMNFKTVHKGKWKVEDDTISITYNPYGKVLIEQYTFREPVYLESINGSGGYTKELN